MVLARSGDPRARQFLRSTVQRTDLPDEVLAVAIRGLGHNYVTGQDASLLRSTYPRLTGQRSQDAILASLSDLGGSENVQWLTAIVRDDKVAPEGAARTLRSDARPTAAPGPDRYLLAHLGQSGDRQTGLDRQERAESGCQTSGDISPVAEQRSTDPAGAGGHCGTVEFRSRSGLWMEDRFAIVRRLPCALPYLRKLLD